MCKQKNVTEFHFGKLNNCSNLYHMLAHSKTNPYLVHMLARADTQDPLMQCRYRVVGALHPIHRLIIVHPDDQERSECFRFFQGRRMSNVEHVEGAVAVHLGALTWWFRSKTCRRSRPRDLEMCKLEEQ